MTHVCTYQEYNVLVRRRQVCLSMLDAPDLPIIIILTLRGKIYPAFGPTELDIGMHNVEKHTDHDTSMSYSWHEWKLKLVKSFPSSGDYAELLTETVPGSSEPLQPIRFTTSWYIRNAL